MGFTILSIFCQHGAFKIQYKCFFALTCLLPSSYLSPGPWGMHNYIIRHIAISYFWYSPTPPWPSTVKKSAYIIIQKSYISVTSLAYEWYFAIGEMSGKKFCWQSNKSSNLSEANILPTFPLMSALLSVKKCNLLQIITQTFPFLF